jgi:hypothetical protein
MKATIKLKPANDTLDPLPLPAPAGGLDVHSLGRRWVAGESIRRLGREAGLPWNVLQGKLRVAGYLRAPKLNLKPSDLNPSPLESMR